MAIYTRFGTEVKIVCRNYDGETVNCKRPDGSDLYGVRIYDLVSDGGISEIEAAIKSTTKD